MKNKGINSSTSVTIDNFDIPEVAAIPILAAKNQSLQKLQTMLLALGFLLYVLF